MYWRPIVQTDRVKPVDAVDLPCGPGWFNRLEVLSRDGASEVVSAYDAPTIKMCQRKESSSIMGILNVTPDSFSDGGQLNSVDAAARRAAEMVRGKVDILDIGGESTRPGADFVDADEEISRTVPVIAAIKASFPEMQISIDTRKANVAVAALEAGATMFNDVSAFTHDSESCSVASETGVKVCLMHASGDPKTMQSNPEYGDVLLDVFDYLEERRDYAIGRGVRKENIYLDPGIGFGKTVEHNLALLRGLSLFHTLGCPILLGASRKRFIGTLTVTEKASERLGGSLAVAIEAARQGVQIVRVHDVTQTRQALTMWQHMAT